MEQQSAMPGSLSGISYSGPVMTERQGKIDALTDRIEDLGKQLDELRALLGRKADKLFGSEPAQDKAAKPVQPPVHGVIARLERAVSEGHRAVADLGQQANRFNGL